MVSVAKGSVRVVFGFPDERLHAFRTARFRSQRLDKDQGIAADRDGVIKFLFRSRNSVVVQPPIAEPEDAQIDSTLIDLPQIDVRWAPIAGREVLEDEGVKELAPVGIVIDERGEFAPWVGKFTLDTADKDSLSPHDHTSGFFRISCIRFLCAFLPNVYYKAVLPAKIRRLWLPMALS